MRNVSMICLLILLSTSCKKSSSDSFMPRNSDFVIPDGTYAGTFQRQTSTGGQVSNVTITFSSNTWIGESEFIHYPALCHGTYRSKSADSITFENSCAWTADFDWTLVLSQDYQIKITAADLEFTRDYGGAFKDVYKMKKQ